MNVKKKAYVAVDTAYSQGALSLWIDDKILLDTTLITPFSHGKNLCQTLQSSMRICKENDCELAGLFVGLGPGSFIGMRISLATLLGFGFAINIPLIGFSSHDALAFSCETSNQNFYIFMKASGDLGYLSHFSSRENCVVQQQQPTEVISILDMKNILPKDAVIFSNQADKLAHILKSRVNFLSGPTPQGVYQAAHRRFSQYTELIDESDFIKPNYIKSVSVSVK